MKITDDHWIEGVRREKLAGGSLMAVRRCLVMHFTSGWSAMSSVDFWSTPAAKGACAHIIIDRDGTIIQCRPFNLTCGHAGASKWTDPKTGKTYRGLNSCSIGIELANTGDMGAKRFPKSMGAGPVALIKARHKHGGPLTAWEKYPDLQLATAATLSRALVERYHLDDCVGHEDIAPKRKNDPGPAFPMPQFRRALGFP